MAGTMSRRQYDAQRILLAPRARRTQVPRAEPKPPSCWSLWIPDGRGDIIVLSHEAIAHTKSEARAAFKKLLGGELTQGAKITRAK